MEESVTTESVTSTDPFKKPLLPVAESACNDFKKPLDPVSDDTGSLKDKIATTSKESAGVTETTGSDSEISVKKASKPRVNVPLPYQEPDWHGHPPSQYQLEIIKNGTLVSTFSIQASLVIFGRLDVCDIIFEHPSVSRYHAIIQYCKGDDTHPKGFYLYDLGSTHGTFLNKEKIKPKIYYKLKVGYILKFGGSSRLHVFQGPEEEEEELKLKEIESEKNSEENVCNWGMGEEAEEEDDLAVNPYALSATNEDLYIEDPKKTLRGWFEREGYELEYSVEEKGFRTFCCTVRLPVDTNKGEYLPVEASVSGKKKEAVVACALEACRTLDNLGLLRQSHHESRQRKRKKWEENDFYDSDEDTFYDRTGDIEKRREMRKRLVKKVEVDNFASISAKLENLNSEIEEIKNKISVNESKKNQNSISNDSDPLDMYMSEISDSGATISDKFERRKLKLRLMELEKEKTRLQKLSDIAKPATMPSLARRHGLVGKKLTSKLKLPPTEEKVIETNENNMDIEENDSEKDDVEPEIIDSKKETIPDNNTPDEKKDFSEVDSFKHEEKQAHKKYGLILNPSIEIESSLPEIISKSGNKPFTDDEITSENRTHIEIENSKNSLNNDDDSKLSIDKSIDQTSELVIPSPRKSDNKKPAKQSKKKDKQSVDVYKTDSNEYCTWTPPSNQSGDGMTHLNAKFGY